MPIIRNHTKSHTLLLGVILIIAPFVLAIVASVALYAWISINDYNGSQSLAEAWFIYALTFIAYTWPALLPISMIVIISGVILLLVSSIRKYK